MRRLEAEALSPTRNARPQIRGWLLNVPVVVINIAHVCM